jgi:hypothetical protein
MCCSNHRRRSCRPWLQFLETRTLASSFTVARLGDIDPNGG